MAATIARPPSAAFGAGTLLGLEYEYRVLRDGEPVDFRQILHDLDVDGRRVDPGDANAYRCGWGGVITADGREAEVAIPPLGCESGFVDQLERYAAFAHRELRTVVPDQLSLEGYSTHLSVATPPSIAEPVATAFAARFSAPLMMMLDRPSSPGLLVRTRPGRTELCGEYASGAALRAASVLAVGGVLACCRAVGDRRYRATLPPAIDLRLEPAVERAGWYVDRAAFGVDLYLRGRGTLLRSGRSRFVAQRHLESAWAVARAAVLPFASSADLRDADAMVGGTLRLGIEETAAPPWSDPPIVGELPDGGFGRAIVARRRPFGRVEAFSVSWDLVVLALHGARHGYLAVPRDHLAETVRRLDAGELDQWIAAFLTTGPAGGCCDRSSMSRSRRCSTTSTRPGRCRSTNHRRARRARAGVGVRSVGEDGRATTDPTSGRATSRHALRGNEG